MSLYESYDDWDAAGQPPRERHIADKHARENPVVETPTGDANPLTDAELHELRLYHKYDHSYDPACLACTTVAPKAPKSRKRTADNCLGFVFGFLSVLGHSTLLLMGAAPWLIFMAVGITLGCWGSGAFGDWILVWVPPIIGLAVFVMMTMVLMTALVGWPLDWGPVV